MTKKNCEVVRLEGEANGLRKELLEYIGRRKPEKVAKTLRKVVAKIEELSATNAAFDIDKVPTVGIARMLSDSIDDCLFSIFDHDPDECDNCSQLEHPDAITIGDIANLLFMAKTWRERVQKERGAIRDEMLDAMADATFHGIQEYGLRDEEGNAA
jgi:hypothetical protein